MSVSEKNLNRREFLSAVADVPILLSGIASEAAVVKSEPRVASPDGQIVFSLEAKPSRLTYHIARKNIPTIEASNIGIIIDGADLGTGAELKKIEKYNANENYASRGVHSTAINNYRAARINAVHPASKTDFTIDVRV